MDRLARNAMLARQANMSYGKWKALQPIATPEKKKIPDGWVERPTCGRPFKPKTGQQRFCEPGCRNSAYKERGNAIRREYNRKRRKEMANNG